MDDHGAVPVLVVGALDDPDEQLLEVVDVAVGDAA